MNLPAIQTASPKIKGSIEIAIDALNEHLKVCDTCHIGHRKTVCPTGNNLMADLDQAIALETITAQI